MTSLALCVLTFRRPSGLRDLLHGIAVLDVPGGVQIRVVVVDNDAAGSARSVVEDAAAWLPFPLDYAVEPEAGIPIARNRALAVAGDVDVVGWLDDDEVPRRDWLRLLLDALAETGADVVLGPSVPEFPPGTPEWVREGGFFDRVRFPTGAAIAANYARTSGVLVRRSAMPARPAPFNVALRYTGGSDRELFVEMERDGARFVWVDEAQVVERVPVTRTRAAWILRRAFRIGNSRSTTLVLGGAGPRRRLLRVAAGLRAVARGAGRAVLGVRRGRAAVAQGAWLCANGAGLVSGALGFRYEEYRTHHGS